MKKSLVARGFIGAVASLLGVAAVGCGADVGDGAAGDSAEIGRAEQALSGTAPVVLTPNTLSAMTSVGDIDPNTNGTQLPVGRELSGSCVISDTYNPGGGIVTRDVLLVVGGFDSAGNALDDAYLYDPVANTWRIAASIPKINNVAQPRGLQKIVRVPGQTTKCLMVGGLSAKSGGSLKAKTLVFTTNGGTGAWTDVGDLAEGRVDFAISQCGDDNVIVFGGRIDSTSSTLRDSIEVWDGNGSTSWHSLKNADDSTTDVTMFTGRASFPYAVQDANHTQFLYASGEATGVSRDLTLGAILTDSNCKFLDKDAGATLDTDFDLSTGGSSLGASTARFGGVAFPDDRVSNSILLAAGENGSTLSTITTRVAMNWATPAISSITASVDTGLTGARYPALVSPAANVFMLVGGEQYNATNHTGNEVGAVQEFDSSGASDWTFASPDLNTDRSGNVAEFLNSKVYTAVGHKTTATAAFLTSIEQITP